MKETTKLNLIMSLIKHLKPEAESCNQLCVMVMGFSVACENPSLESIVDEFINSVPRKESQSDVLERLKKEISFPEDLH